MCVCVCLYLVCVYLFVCTDTKENGGINADINTLKNMPDHPPTKKISQLLLGDSVIE